jgi:hypothetical protein
LPWGARRAHENDLRRSQKSVLVNNEESISRTCTFEIPFLATEECDTTGGASSVLEFDVGITFADV